MQYCLSVTPLRKKPVREKKRSVLSRVGPGFITGASDDDPSGIATYAQIGAQFGYGQLWLTLFSIPFMIAVQEMCGRIGLVTGKGLSGVLKKHYPRAILYGAVALLCIANMVNIGADMVAMAAAARLVVPLPYAVLLTAVVLSTLAMMILIPYKRYVTYLKYLTLSLFAYVVVAFVVKQDVREILAATLLPTFSLSQESLMTVVAFLGTTISPYLFFWQVSEEVEEEVAEKRIQQMGVGTPRVSTSDIRDMRIDTSIGMVFSNIVSYFIIITAASTLHRHGITHVESAAAAAKALEPIAGSFASILFALGIIGTGLLAIPVLAGSAAYAVAEIFDWKESLSLPFHKARAFYRVIILSTIGGLLVLFTGIQPFVLLYYTAILNGLAAPPLLILILLVSNNKKVMGKRTNGLLSNLVGGLIAVLMTACAGVLLFSFTTGA